MYQCYRAGFIFLIFLILLTLSLFIHLVCVIIELISLEVFSEALCEGDDDDGCVVK